MFERILYGIFNGNLNYNYYLYYKRNLPEKILEEKFGSVAGTEATLRQN